MSRLHDLVEGSSKITSSMTGVDYNNDDDHEDDDTMPSFLFLDPQEFIRSSSKAISIFGADDKTKAGFVQDVAISVTGSQYLCTNVAEGQAPRASDHDFNTEHLIPSLTHIMSITSDAGDYIYSDSEE